MSIPSFVEELLEAAVLAPSGDNTQPWRFAVDPAGQRLRIEVDPDRDPSPMNLGQRMSRVAVGAALENVVIRAQTLNLPIEISVDEADANSVTVHWKSAGVSTASASTESDPILDVLRRRVTNRRNYDSKPISPEILRKLEAENLVLDGVRTVWITSRERLDALGALIGAADALMFGDPSMRAAFFKNVRFDAPALAPVTEGLSKGSLELKGPECLLLPLLSKMPDRLVKLLGATKTFADRARAVIRSSSGLCLTVAPDERPETDLAVGRAMERAWLSLAGQNLAAQPMMSLMILGNLQTYGSPELLQAVGEEQIQAIGASFRELVPEIADGRPAFLIRFGYAPDPSARTARLSWRDRLTSMPDEGPIASRSELQGWNDPAKVA